MRLWTFQRPEVVARFPSGSNHDAYHASWDGIEESWRPAYRWMARALARSTRTESKHAPVWCWQSANGSDDEVATVPGSAPTLTTARDLTGGGCSVILLELEVPADEVLLSSYSRWNSFLDESLEQEGVCPADAHWTEMFEDPLLDFPEDDIQAVVGRIEFGWIRSQERWDVPERR